jgi:signal transduction histidine kinase
MLSSSLRAIGSMTPSPMTALSDSIVPRRAGRVLLVCCWLVVIYGTVAAVPLPARPREIVAWVATVVFLLSFTVAIERPTAVRLLRVSGLAAVVMQFCAPSNSAFVALIAVIAVAGVRLDTASSRAVALLSGLGFLAASAFSARPLSLTEIDSMLPALLFTYLGSIAMRRLRAEQRRTEELLDEVVAGRDAVIRAAALDERAHLAREMHDVLAHTLSALCIQLEGTRMLAERRPSDPAIVAGLERTSRLAKDGLGEARRAVGSLRGELLPGPELLPQLAQEFERDTGVPCRLQIEGTTVELDADARLAMYRIVQEALTNVRKHADSSRVDIRLRSMADGVELTIENQGVLRASPLPGGGYGVSGMRERAALLNGKLEVGPSAGGYRVRLWMPTHLNRPFAS